MTREEQRALYRAYMDCIVAAGAWRVATLPELWERSMKLEMRYNTLAYLARKPLPEGVAALVQPLLEAVRAALNASPTGDLFFAPPVQLLTLHSAALKELLDGEPWRALDELLEAQ